MMIVILITLFEINIVASSIFGFLINFRINLCRFTKDAFILLLSVGVKEKNAISEPEIKPEKINSKKHDKRGVSKL